MQEKSITITLKAKQIVNDVVVRCSLLGRTMREAQESSTQNTKSELPSYIMSPDDSSSKPLIARSLTEGFSAVKNVCGRYLVTGRTTDDDRLEQIATKATTSSGSTSSSYTYVEYKLGLAMPVNFNTGVTETIKSTAHKAMVDYVMKEFLFDQLADKSKEYGAAFDNDLDKLKDALMSRITDASRRPTDWS